jgi:hypothetical protein
MPTIYSEQFVQENQPSSPTNGGNVLRIVVLITAILFTILNTTWCIFRAVNTIPTIRIFDKIFACAICFVSVAVGLCGIVSAIDQLKPKTQLQLSILYILGLILLFIAEVSLLVYSLSKVGSAGARVAGLAILIGYITLFVLFFVIYGSLGLLSTIRIIQLRKITHK